MSGWLRSFLAGVLATVAVAGLYVVVSRPRPAEVEIIIATPAAGQLTVAVSGEVLRPGIYSLPLGARVADLLAAAGGTTAAADPAVPSRALLLRDEMHVHVPVFATPTAPTPSPTVSVAAETGAVPPTGAININTAGVAELETLPGIGAVLAQRIVAERQRNGPFKSVDELQRVAGMGPALIGRIRDRVSV